MGRKTIGIIAGVVVLLGVVADDEGEGVLADLPADTLAIEPLAAEETEELVRRATASASSRQRP